MFCVSLCVHILDFNMDMSHENVCSLEDEDANELFITQSCYKSDNTADEVVDDDGLLEMLNGFQFGVLNTDFGLPMVSVVCDNKDWPVYEDISDGDFDEGKEHNQQKKM